MAIYWVDPYLNTGIGGIHGTTSSGSGTYAAPYDLSWNGSGLSSGDEIRLKGLSESSFWSSTGNSFQVTEYGSVSGQDQYYYGTGGASLSGKVLRVRTDQNQDLLRFYVYSSPMRTVPFHSYGQLPLPILDKTYGYDEFDTTNYQITSSYNFLTSIGTPSSTSDRITLTAGWTSETVQGGVTILASNGYLNLGQSGSTSANGSRLTTDSKSTLHFMTANYGSWYLNDFKVGTFATKNSSSLRIYATKSVDIGFTNTTRLDIYSYQSANARFDTNIDVWLPWYSADFTVTVNESNVDNTATRFQTTFKQLHLGQYLRIKRTSGSDLHKMNIINATDSYRSGYNAAAVCSFTEGTRLDIGTYTAGTSSISNEWTWHPTATDEVYAGEDFQKIAFQWKPITSPSVGKLSSGSSPFDVGYASQYYYLPNQLHDALNNTSTLETIDSKIAKLSFSTPLYGHPIKFTVLADGESGRPFQLVWPSNYSTTTYPMFVFRSPSFSDKTVWHFTSHSNSGIYADTFAIDLPSYASGDLTFDCSFTTSSSPGVTVKATLYTIDSNGVDSSYGQQTASGSGTSLSISQTISQATLTSNDAQSAYVILEITKTNTTVSNVAIDSIGLS